jgi:hypothetical protein
VVKQPLEVGQWVYVNARNFPTSTGRHKLGKKWLGPFQVEKRIGSAAYKLKVNESWRGHPIFNKESLKPHHGPPPPVEEEATLPQEPER